MKRILNSPYIYDFYQKLIGGFSYKEKFVRDFLNFNNGFKMLDLGCGSGIILNFMDKEFEYVGVDASKQYIDYLTKKYSSKSYNFICQSVCEKLPIDEIFDVVLSQAVLTALSLEQIKDMFSVISSHCDEKTKIIFSDMNFKNDACMLQRFLQINERNSYPRGKEDYLKIIPEYFNIEKITELDSVYRIPYSKIVFECSIKK